MTGRWWEVVDSQIVFELRAKIVQLEEALRIITNADPDDYVIKTCNGTIESYEDVVEGDTILVTPEKP
jgi:hypothetical protein